MSSEGFICEVCHLDYSTQTQFEEHFWSMIHHKQLEIQYGTGKTHICCLCKTQSDTLSEYAKHLISKTHRDASAARKKQKQLEVASKSSNQRSSARQQTNTPNNGYPGLQNPAVQNKRPIFCIPEPGQNVHRTWARWSQPNHPINNFNVQPNVQHSSAQHSAQQLNHGNGGKGSYAGNRTWTPVSGQGGPNAPTNKSVGGLKTQLASGKSAVNPSLTAKNKAQDSKANPNTGSGREPRAATASVNSKSAFGSKPAQSAVKHRDNHRGANKLDSNAASRASSSKSGQALDCREVHSAAKEATPEKVATCDSTKISCAKPDQSAGTNPTATQTLAQPDGAFSAKREWERSASCPSRTSKPGQDKMSCQDKAERSKNASAASALKKPKEACKQTHVLQRSNSVPGTPTLLKLPPEVTRLNLPRVNSVPGGKESIKNLSSIGPNTVEDQPESDLIDGVDEEPSVTRVQLPPSLQRELTKLLVKSQGPRPRPNLVAARSRLHAGEHHQAQVVESPDRMVQQLLMKLLDSPKSRDRQLQQIEELQRLVQASKKGSERARFGAQQLPVVSMQVLESLLESGHLKPLLSEDNFTRGTMAQQEQSLDSAAHEQVNSQKDGKAQNLSNTAIFHQELSPSLSAPDPADVDSKEAVQALIRSTLSKKGHLSTSSASGHEEENSKEALKSFTTSEAPAAPLSQSTLLRQRRQSASEMMREIVGHIVQTQDKPTGAEQPSAPVADVTIKTEPDTEVNESGDTCKWVQDFELVDSKEAVRPLIQSTSSASEHPKVDSKEPLKSLISAYANPATFHLWSTSPKQEEQVAAEVQDQTTVPDQLSTPTRDLTIKTEPDTHANDITDGAPNEENPVPTSTATWQLNASLVQPFTYDSVLSSGQISSFPMDMNNSLHVQDFAVLSAPTEQESTTPGQAGTTVNMLTMPNYQVVVPYAETTPTITAPAQRKPRAKQTRMSQKDLPSDLQEVLLELSLQEEKLHEKLSMMDRRMKTTKELIQKKQLQYKKLKDQKNKISMEVLGIRTRRLQLLQEAKPCSASAVTSSTTTSTNTSQITQDPLGNFPAWLPNATVSQGNTTLSSFQGGAVPNLTFVDCDPTSLLNCPLSSELALGPLLTFPSVDSLDSSSPNMPRTQPGPGTLTPEPANQQGGVGKASKASKRSLKNATNAAVTKKAKTGKVSKTPNLTGSKSVRRKPTTQAVPDSTQATHVATASASTSNLANSDVASIESSMNAPKEIYSPYKNWVKEVKLHNMIDTQYRSKVTWIKVEKTPQELRDETGSESRPGCSLGSSRPSGLCKSVEGVQTQSTTEPGCYDVFEISSDSEGSSASLCKSFTKTRPATASHARATPAQAPQKPDVKPCSSTQTWPPCGVFPNHDGAVLGMHLCISRQRLYTVAADCTARVFDINDFSCKKVLSDHTKEVTCLKMWSSKYVCTGSSDRSVRVYNTETLDREISFFCESRVTCLAARVHWLYAGLANGTVDVIDMQRLRLEKNLSCKPECKINSMIPVDPVPVKGRIRKCVLVGYEDWTIGVHDTLNGKLLQSLHGHNGPILCMMIFQQLLYSGSADKTIMVHDFKTGEHLRKIGGHGSSVTGLSVFEGSLLSVSLDGKIRHIAHTGGLRRIIASFPQKIQCMTHHNQTLYIGCSDGTVQAISMQASTRPGNARKKKKKSKKVRVMCKWKGCTTKKSVHHKIYAHLWHNHVVPIAGKKCLWGKCGIMLTNFNRFQVNQHMHNHLMELYDGLQPDDAEKFKTQALLHQRKFGKKGVVNKALQQIMLAKSTAGGNKKIKPVPFSLVD
ncbi:uncharacterized protein LOC119740740 [Patiria miniata]|uniref:C2H2-type domain-containing protein n=1 Tax=Patiria miniata TaxID=46514 RepID=A0A914B7D5_PATMI|nr:uncharacterized protein LOC119740740 [Patiria miniata]